MKGSNSKSARRVLLALISQNTYDLRSMTAVSVSASDSIGTILLLRNLLQCWRILGGGFVLTCTAIHYTTSHSENRQRVRALGRRCGRTSVEIVLICRCTVTLATQRG